MMPSSAPSDADFMLGTLFLFLLVCLLSAFSLWLVAVLSDTSTRPKGE